MTAAITILLCAAVTAAVAQSLVDRPQEVFLAANASYETGDYHAAIESYRRLTDAGAVDADLFYNLGNAYYKNNELGPAVLFYVRALKIRPRDDDAKENLELVRLQLRVKQFVRHQNRLVAAVVWLHNNLSTREMVIFTSVSYLLVCLLAIVLIFHDTRVVSAVYRKVSVLSPGRLVGLGMKQDLILALGIAAFLLVTSGISSYRKITVQRTEAVVLSAEVSVFSSPTDDATLQFKIHEGTVVNIGDRRGEWARIELPGGMSGWVDAGSIEKV
jgi:hypothetical protein